MPTKKQSMPLVKNLLSLINKKTPVASTLLFVLVLMFFMTPTANAQQPDFAIGFANAIFGAQGLGLVSASGGLNSFPTIIMNIVNVLFAVVGSLALLAVVYGGIMYIMSMGNEQRSARAKQILLYAIIGLFVAGTAFGIVYVVSCEILEISPTIPNSICYDPVTVADFVALIFRTVGVIMAPAAALAFGALVYGGYTYIASAGDEARAAKAKKIILYAFIGLVTIGLSGILVNIILNLVLF